MSCSRDGQAYRKEAYRQPGFGSAAQGRELHLVFPIINMKSSKGG
ncbi:ribonuclease P [Bacillus sp. NRRL B-14911]|nr:ribonuclease P [Bacillus sp. NRRL B-14911]